MKTSQKKENSVEKTTDFLYEKNKNNKNVKTIFKLHRKKSYEILVTKILKENPKTRSHKKVLIKNNERNSLSVTKTNFY